jgi:NADH dehydrogenase/NADH:ubiquinone oxidoreductase subunit G
VSTNTLTLRIDGRTVQATEGESLLDVARRAGVHIPTLCDDDTLKPSGACRMCMVEVKKGERTRLVASCVYSAEAGIEVTTDNERISKIRRLIVELLWPSWTREAEAMGVKGSRFASGAPESDCSQCGLCVRYCNEVAKKGIAYFAGRGINRHPALVPGTEEECAGCGACFSRCTGGWIVSHAGVRSSTESGEAR